MNVESTATAAARPRILIVEDEGVVAWDMERSLQDSFDVTGIAGSGEEALERAAERCPDLVLMDIRIRGKLDGIETAKQLKSRFGVPIVYLTAHGDAETVERARKTDPYGYLLKPFKRPDLLSAVRIALYRHRMERELREREHLVRTTMQSIGEAVVTTDPAGRITGFNPSAERLTGWRTEEVTMRPAAEILSLIDERSHGAVESPIDRALRDKTTVRLDTAVLVDRQGVEHPVVNSASPIFDEHHVYGAVMVLRDVTEGRRLQRQLEFADRLASLGTMAAGVAHEINNPLAFIVANIEHAIGELEAHVAALVAEGFAPDTIENLNEVVSGLCEAKEGSARVARIVTDLRNFSRDERSVDGTIDLRDVLDWAINVTAHAWRHRAKIVRNFMSTPVVQGEEARLSQVFVNLIVNAAQAIEPGHPAKNEIRISARTNTDGWAVIEVEDTGTGMTEDVTRRIFEPFFTTKPIGSGTGLGLSICHGIVSAMGGTITAKSVAGVGSKFSITLPPAAEVVKPPEPSRPAPEAPRARSRVLVIDDDPFVRVAIARTVQARHDAVAVSSVREALECLAKQAFDVVLCDLMMPEESGVDFHRHVMDKYPALVKRIIYLTGGAFSAPMAKFLQELESPKLEKPFDSSELHALIDDFVSGRRG